MGDQDKFERVLVSLHDAMLDDTLWPATSALLDEACGMQGNALVIGAGPPDALRISSVGFYSRGEQQEGLEREYLEVYHPIDERVPRLRRLPDSRLVPVTELYTAEELRTSPTYNEVMLRLNAQDGLNVRLAEPDGDHITWALGDPVGRSGWESSQLTMVKALLPHIRQFVRVRRALVKAEALSASLTALLDTAQIGILHLDRYGRIVEMNDRARAILRQGDGLVDQGGVLSACVPADRDRLERLVAGALPTSSTPAVSGSMTIRRPSVWLPFVVHVKPVGSRQRDFGARRVAAQVLLVEPGHAPRIDPLLVEATLGLTPMESRIAAWVTEGMTVREIAKATGLTERAIRWHLYRAYHKHGLSGQVDLVRLVLSVTALI